jgi:diguanylate cyclase (GGDEF)-like protein/PAS domain S-box-containing protein
MGEHQPDFSSLFELLPLGAYRIGVNGVVMRVNAALLAINGYATEAEMRSDLGDVVPNPYFHPERRREFQETLLKQGFLRGFESEMVRYKGGDRFWARENAHVVYDDNGQALYFEGTIEDFTAERAAVDAVQEREAMLQQLLQTIPDHVWLKDLKGVYLTCNEAFALGLGKTPQEIVGLRDQDLVPQAIVDYFQSTDDMAIKAGRPITVEDDHTSAINPEGATYEVIKAAMRDAHGEVIGVLGMGRNIQQRKNAEIRLRDTSEQLELALMGADLGRWDHDLTEEKGYYLDERSCKMLGRDPQESDKGRAWGHLIHPDDLALTMQAMRNHLNGTALSFEAEYRARHSNNSWIWLSSRGKAVQFKQDGTALRMVGTLMDITARKVAEEKLRTTQAELQATLDALPDLLFEFSVEGRYIMAHSHDPSALLKSTDFLVGKTVREVMPGDAADICMAAIEDARKTGRSQGRQYSLELPKGKQWFELSVAVKPAQPGDEERFIAIARDITDSKIAEESIRHLAFHDSLTGLPNRRLLTDRLQQALSNSSRHSQHGALMFLDLDQFKQLNDTHGHETGDLLLEEIAKRLLQSVRAIDTVARLGGDEFVVLIQELSTNAQDAEMHATIVGHKILSSLNEPYQLRGQTHSTTPSIGVTLFHGDTVPHHEIIKQADHAMYQAKAGGRNMVCFYKPNWS